MHHYHKVLDYIAQVVDKLGSQFRVGVPGLPRLGSLECFVGNIGNCKHLVECLFKLCPLKKLCNLSLACMDISPQSIVHRSLWNFAVIVFIHKQQGAVYKVSKVTDKLTVHLLLEIFPSELEI